MSRRNEHLVVIMLEPVSFNVEFEVWPQHITVVPWFHAEDDERLDKVLSSVATRHKKFEVTAGRSEKWGDKEKFEVVIIEDYRDDLAVLHEDVVYTLEQNGFFVHQKDFLGDKYRPHVTLRNELQKDQGRPWKGQVYKVKEFSLVSQVRLKKTGRMIKRLKKNYELSD